MDEIEDGLIEMLTEKLVDIIGDSGQADELISQATEALQQSLTHLSTSLDTMSDESKEQLIDSVLSTLSIASDAPGINDVVQTAASINSSSFDQTTWSGEFTDGCWNVCTISSGEGALRMTCGYHT
ncbi:MAG: hypothetical protein AUK63_1179 [bacterium P3]|nr:MAG: hypothetical protein AUK63_1179 [bacterium P3]KWW40345.1 MAG: hypothetical protein F083_1727 [bacterium F083]